MLQEAQDVGALECRPFETPPLRVEDVVGHGTGVGSIGIVSGSVGGVGGDGGICVGGGGSVGHAPSFTCQPAPHAQDRRRAPVICCLACVAHQHVDTGAQALARDKLSAACRVGVLRVSVDGACSFSRRRQDRLSNGCCQIWETLCWTAGRRPAVPLLDDWLGLRIYLDDFPPVLYCGNCSFVVPHHFLKVMTAPGRPRARPPKALPPSALRSGPFLPPPLQSRGPRRPAGPPPARPPPWRPASGSRARRLCPSGGAALPRGRFRLEAWLFPAGPGDAIRRQRHGELADYFYGSWAGVAKPAPRLEGGVEIFSRKDPKV